MSFKKLSVALNGPNLGPFLYVICILTMFTAMSLADESIVLTKTRLRSPDYFIKTLETHIKDHYEAEHPTEMSQISERLNQCNPKKSLKMPSSYRGSFTVCMDLFIFDLWAGMGKFSIESTDDRGRNLLLSGTSPFVGGQILFPYTLGSNVILEGKYWYMPSFAIGTSAINDLQTSSIVEGILIYQKRIPQTQWSFRVGALGTKLPLAKNNSVSSLMAQTDIEFRNVLLGGPVVGIKLAFNRLEGIQHLFYVDMVAFPYSDNRLSFQVQENNLIRLGYKWFLNRRWAVTVDGEYTRFQSKYDDTSTTMIGGVGIQAFLF